MDIRIFTHFCGVPREESPRNAAIPLMLGMSTRRPVRFAHSRQT